MSNFNYDTQYVSVVESAKIATIDLESESVSSDSRYSSVNKMSYYVLINTWLFQVEDLTSKQAALCLKDAIQQVGLLAVIKQCDEAASTLLQGYVTYLGYTCPKLPDYLYDFISQVEIKSESKEMSLRHTLQVLRYAKRFSPALADVTQKRGIQSFIEINATRGSKLPILGETRDMHTDPFISGIGAREVWCDRIHSYFEKFVKGFRVNYDSGFFSNGSASDANRTLAAKIAAFAQWQPYFYSPWYPLPGDGYRSVPTYGKERHPYYVCTMKAVPKSYKTPRIIAMEDSWRQFHAQAIRLELERCLKKNKFDRYITLDDQRTNQEACRLGSIEGSYATVDLSSASDSISRSLAWRCIPRKVWEELDKFIPTHVAIEGEKTPRKLSLFLTSGNAATFVIESELFLAIALAVTDYAQLFCDNKLLEPRVFGDDMVIDLIIFPALCQVLNLLGFQVNSGKSFADNSLYRESCGVEYVSGLDTTTKYFPRKTLFYNNDVESLVSLCALEQRLYGNFHCRRFLVQLVRFLEPRMTSHSVGQECSDLWETLPNFKTSRAPIKRGSVIPETLLGRKVDLSGKDRRDLLDPTADMVSNDAVMRHRHLTVKRKKLNKHSRINCGGVEIKSATLVDHWRYYHWLLQGPTYEDDLLRLLGVSQAPTDSSDDCSLPELEFGWNIEW